MAAAAAVAAFSNKKVIVNDHCLAHSCFCPFGGARPHSGLLFFTRETGCLIGGASSFRGPFNNVRWPGLNASRLRWRAARASIATTRPGGTKHDCGCVPELFARRCGGAPIHRGRMENLFAQTDS